MPSMLARIATPSVTMPVTSSLARADEVSLWGMYLIAKPTSTIPIGTLTRKIPRHDQYVTKMPPSTGPMIPPIGLKLVNMLTARSRPAPNESATIPVAEGMNVAPPIACTPRSTMSHVMLSTSPQHSDETVNTTMAQRNTVRRPY